VNKYDACFDLSETSLSVLEQCVGVLKTAGWNPHRGSDSNFCSGVLVWVTRCDDKQIDFVILRLNLC
jgi:hypothetical protein